MTAALADRIGGIIRDVLGVEVPSHDTDLLDSGLLDSLALVSLLAEIEREFAIELPLEDLDVDQFRTVERAATYLSASGAAR